MAIVKIPKYCLISQDQDSITLNLPDDYLKIEPTRDYEKIEQARGLLKSKRQDLIAHSQRCRQEWE
jgi:hypothetical protein